jgi:Universal stress protein family
MVPSENAHKQHSTFRARPGSMPITIRLKTQFDMESVHSVLVGELNLALVTAPPQDAQITAVPFAPAQLYAVLPDSDLESRPSRRGASCFAREPEFRRTASLLAPRTSGSVDSLAGKNRSPEAANNQLSRKACAGISPQRTADPRFGTGPRTLRPRSATCAENDVGAAWLALRKIVGTPNGHGGNVETIIVVGHPADEIIKRAGQSRSDLVVVGRRGASLFKNLEMGSVSEHCSGSTEILARI